MFPQLGVLKIDEDTLLSLANDMATSLAVADNQHCPAGYTYFGQFIAHDLSLMRNWKNGHSPNLSLEPVYGRSDRWSTCPHGRDESENLLFQLGRGGGLHGAPSAEIDLPRSPDGTPDIPDARNDLHTIISQLHLAFMRLHNRFANDLAKGSPRKSSREIFTDAYRKVCWLYQWLVVNDFLSRLCDEQLMRRLWPRHNVVEPELHSYLSNPSPGIGLEFALAAFRFGHSMARPNYRLNSALPPRAIFREGGDVQWDADLRGHRKLLVEWSVQWDLFLGRNHPGQQYARRITPNIVPSLGLLPAFAIEEEPRHLVNLAERTLTAGNGLLPSGQDVAHIVVGKIYPRLDLATSEVLDPERADPLWHYVLKEAQHCGQGLRLGPVGSWIIASTLSSALLMDKSSFVHATTWEPDLPVDGETLELVDLVRYAGMPISREDWTSYVAGYFREAG